MKILFLGEIGPGQTSLMRMRALERLGHRVTGIHTVEPWTRVTWISRQIQRSLRRGFIVENINKSVVDVAHAFRPDVVWAEKQEYLRGETLQKLRELGAKLVHFTPDPYFALDWKRTRLMDRAMVAFDVLVYCKSYESRHYQALGKPLVYMPLGYCDEVHRPLPSDDARWRCHVGFIGGWEPRRQRLLHAVAATGADLKMWGQHWEFLADGRWTPRRSLILRQLAGAQRFRIHRDPMLARARQGGEIYADDYARALSGAEIGLGFLRTVCPDQHTTRTFEIPACGSMLLADRTEEHQSFFTEGKEAEFFSSQAEMLDKIRFYRANVSARKKISKSGLERCRASRYAYVHRLDQTLKEIALLAP